jgi:hypothetical protein
VFDIYVTRQVLETSVGYRRLEKSNSHGSSNMEKTNAGIGLGSRGSSIRTFDWKNYKVWAWQMELLLARERAWTIVTGSEECPPGPKAEVDQDGHVTAGKAASSAYTVMASDQRSAGTSWARRRWT